MIKILGAVITVNRFKHPVSLARLVMDCSDHCALSGDGAVTFAEEEGFPLCNPEDLKGPNFPNQKLDVHYKDYKKFGKYVLEGKPVEETHPPENLPQKPKQDRPYMGELVAESHPQVPSQNPAQPFDTVSAVAMDKNGHVACAMSTGNFFISFCFLFCV